METTRKDGVANVTHLESGSEPTGYTEKPLEPEYTKSGYSIARMSNSHKEFILSRHGTLDLDPMPSEDPNEPYNWPRWKSLLNLSLLSFHALMVGFMTGGPISAFGAFADEFDVSIDAAAYTVSVPIVILGMAPLFWLPLSARFGRRPIWLTTTILSMVCNIGCACSHSYSQIMVARAFQSFFNAPAGAIGSAVVIELFFASERGQKLGVWTVAVTLGNPLGPLLMGFVATRVGWRWIFWIFSIINGIQFFAFLFLSPETRYVQGVDGFNTGEKLTFTDKYLRFGRIPGSDRLVPRDFWAPITLLRDLNISTTALSHMVIFCFCSVLVNVEIPNLIGTKFNLNFESIGLNFIPLVIGNVIGEVMSGPLSDWWCGRATKNGVPARPERRLWLLYPALGICVAGLVVFLVTLDEATPGQWNVRPNIGLALAGLGNQMSTTIFFTYGVEKNIARSGEVGVALVMVRQIWSFIGPFWFPAMFASIGLRGSAALCSALMVVFSGLVMVIQQFWIGPRHT
ncbi:putative MFS transporter [Thozetella sp. PMI_491]|nr:putative MFS transporter [Thozetella sp. PMI_491]